MGNAASYPPMVESMARAMCHRDRVDPDLIVRRGADRKKVAMWRVYAGYAEAALSALLHPTPAMKRVGAWRLRSTDAPHDLAHDAFIAMIEEAGSQSPLATA